MPVLIKATAEQEEEEEEEKEEATHGAAGRGGRGIPSDGSPLSLPAWCATQATYRESNTTSCQRAPKYGQTDALLSAAMKTDFNNQRSFVVPIVGGDRGPAAAR